MSVEFTPQGTLQSRNPANLKVLGEAKITSAAEIETSVAQARDAFQKWSRLSLPRRLEHIERFHQCLMARRDELAALITAETGKPLLESYGAELFGPLETCRWLRSNAVRLLKPQTVRLNPIFFLGKKSYNVFEPLGMVAVISPWNYAFSIPVCTMLTALATGNAVVLKPSPKTPLIALAIKELFEQAGFPSGLVSVVLGDREEAKTLVSSAVDRVVFTGSVPGGKAIMALASQKLHAVTLELGGKHPAIVLDDADVDRIAPAIVWGAFTNAGQACASIERVYVAKQLAEPLSKRVAQLAGQLKLGDGTLPDTDVGPLIDEDQLTRVKSLIDDAVAQGARVMTGGRVRPDLGGYFLEPTVLTGVKPEMRLMREEIFGPVVPFIPVESEAEAVQLANDSPYGLGASVFTADRARGERTARLIRAGMVWVNDGLYSHSCPDAPWGGIKDSGFGKTHSAISLQEFVYVKHVGADKQRTQDWHYPYNRERLDLIRGAMELCHGRGLVTRLKALVRLIPNWIKTRRSR